MTERRRTQVNWEILAALAGAGMFWLAVGWAAVRLFS